MRAAPPASGEPRVVTLKANKSPSTTLALTNCVFVHPEDAKALTSPPNSFLPANNYVSVKDFVFSFMANNEITKGDIGFSLIQRNTATIGLNEQLQVASWCPKEKNIFLSFLKIEVDFLAKNTPPETFKVKNLVDLFLQQFMHQCFTVEQKLVVELSGKNLCFRVAEIEVINFESISNPALAAAQPQQQKQGGRRGVLMKNTQVVFIKPASSSLKLEGDEGQGESGSFQSNQIFRMDFSWEKLGIGGLDEELATVFRRAFASRIFPASLVAKMGIKHVKGMLLFGPPGTGKTLIARQIGKLLNGKEPKVVSGPEILNKFVGQSEENVRLLFKDAEEEYKAKGDESQLHIIIFDEIDAICKARGSRGGDTGVGDSVVNQLLSKIDGVNSLNNILVIGMTNRKDMIDEALLRPGRLEVQMEIGLPDQNGRMQILRIHTATMTKNGLLDPDVNLQDLALRTKNFSGAEIEGLVKSAASFAFERQIDPNHLDKPINPQNVKVKSVDFNRALDEVVPNFGVSGPEFDNCLRNGMLHYGPTFDKLMQTGLSFINQVKNSEHTHILTILLEGIPGTGKTALAASLALKSDFPFIKLISPEQFIGYTESAKVSALRAVFENAYKSPLSMIVIDDIERLLEFVRIGPRFSNLVLQALLVLLKKPPPKGRKLLVVGTTSSFDFLQSLEMAEVFGAVVNNPPLSSKEEVARVLNQLNVFSSEAELERAIKGFQLRIPIKRLLLLVEMAKQGDEASFGQRFQLGLAQFQEKDSYFYV